jgi:hypothetical protein
MVRPARLERATSWFVARRSIQLSYGRDRLTILAWDEGRSKGPGSSTKSTKGPQCVVAY